MKGRGNKKSTPMLHRYENRKFWTPQEDQIIRDSILEIGCDWKQIAAKLEGRNASQCAQRWKRIKPKNMCQYNNKWTLNEDQLVINFVQQYGQRWNYIASHLQNRTGRQVRERFLNNLDFNLKKGNWTQNEDKLIWNLYTQIGTKWSQMAKIVEGRSENMIKNRFYSYVRSNYGNMVNPYYEVTIGQLETQNNSSDQQSTRKPIYKLRKQIKKSVSLSEIQKNQPIIIIDNQKTTIDLNQILNQEDLEFSVSGHYIPKIINYSTDDVFSNNFEQEVSNLVCFEQINLYETNIFNNDVVI